jgi:hypothetical protein
MNSARLAAQTPDLMSKLISGPEAGLENKKIEELANVWLTSASFS